MVSRLDVAVARGRRGGENLDDEEGDADLRGVEGERTREDDDVGLEDVELVESHVVGRGIALPLASSDDVPPGQRVEVLGYPAVGFDDATMRPEAAYRVRAKDRQVAGQRPMRGDGAAIEMTADIHHGDSGGPVLHDPRYVIGLNVAGPEGAASAALAVPLRLARARLEQLGVRPDPGPRTEPWIEALADYHAGRYAEAERRVDGIGQIQVGARGTDGRAPIVGSVAWAFASHVSPYVRDLSGLVYASTHPQR